MVSNKLQFSLINKLKAEVKNNDVIKNLFKEYDLDTDEIDLVPMCFKDLSVSARTEHGIIYLNTNLLEDPDNISHYIAHELTHFCQQTTGEGPTKGSNDQNYLKNPYEVEGFQMQTEFISDTKGDEAAEEYVDKVIDHHGLKGKEREERKKDLLQLAGLKPEEQLSLFTRPKSPAIFLKKEDLDREYDEAVARGPEESHARPMIKKLHPTDQAGRVKKLKEILEMLNKG